MPPRRCLGCGVLTPSTRCPACTAARNIARGSFSARGYDATYRAARKQLLATATNCHWCGTPIGNGAATATADHDPPLHDGGSHDQMVAACAPCNYGRRRSPNN